MRFVLSRLLPMPYEKGRMGVIPIQLIRHRKGMCLDQGQKFVTVLELELQYLCPLHFLLTAPDSWLVLVDVNCGSKEKGGLWGD